MKTIKNMTADQLRKSILQLAIQGKLVKQDPKDEPASVLVDKIYEEKKKLIAEGKIKKEKIESRIFKGDDNRYYEKIGKETENITDKLPFEIPENWEWIRLKNFPFAYPVQYVTSSLNNTWTDINDNVSIRKAEITGDFGYVCFYSGNTYHIVYFKINNDYNRDNFIFSNDNQTLSRLDKPLTFAVIDGVNQKLKEVPTIKKTIPIVVLAKYSFKDEGQFFIDSVYYNSQYYLFFGNNKTISENQIYLKRIPFEEQIQYDNIMLGSMLNIDGSFYVLIEDADDIRLSEYTTMVQTIKANDDAPTIYTADLSSGFNKEYLGDESDYSSDMEKFKVTGTTLVKVSDNEIADVYDNYDDIIKKLDELD